MEEKNLHNTSKYNTGRVIVTLSLFLHLVLLPRVLYYQLVTMKKEQQPQLGIINNENSASDVNKTQRNVLKSLKDNQNNNILLLYLKFCLYLSYRTFSKIIRTAIYWTIKTSFN